MAIYENKAIPIKNIKKGNPIISPQTPIKCSDIINTKKVIKTGISVFSDIIFGFNKYVSIACIIAIIINSAITFPNPPIEEQLAIVNHIENKTSKLDTLIKKATKSIKLLKEKRTALISAAVTGKVDVREIV